MENIENINVIFHNIVSKHAGKRISALKYLMSVCVREKTEKIGKEISAFLECTCRLRQIFWTITQMLCLLLFKKLRPSSIV